MEHPMRFLFRPPAAEAAGLLSLPWETPLEEWDADLLVHVPSRRGERSVAADGQSYALKEVAEPRARHEYAMLGDLEAAGMPTVSVLGVCVDRPHGQPAVLVTRHLGHAMSHRHLLSSSPTAHSAAQLVGSLVALLVRLHLGGVSWGGCSLSTTLFRADAGGLAAHLADAEAVTRHPQLSRRRREDDVDLAVDRVRADLLDLAAGGMLPAGTDPVELAAGIRPRYEGLWDELTQEEVVGAGEQRWRVAARHRRLNDLGFDAGDVELVSEADGFRLRVETRVSQPGLHRRELFRLTGLEASENQARRLLDDLRGHRAHLESAEGLPISELAAGQRWVGEEYQPVVDAVPPHLAGRLAPAELFHEVLEHRWFLSETAGRDVGTSVAARSYVETVLPRTTPELTSAAVLSGP
jgi:hypothetical protein